MRIVPDPRFNRHGKPGDGPDHGTAGTSFCDGELREVRRRTTQNLDLLLKDPCPTAERYQLLLLHRRLVCNQSVTGVRLIHPGLHRVSEILKSQSAVRLR